MAERRIGRGGVFESTARLVCVIGGNSSGVREY